MYTKIVLSLVLCLTIPVSYAWSQQTEKIVVSSTSAKILGDESANQYSDLIDADEEVKWTIHIPENFNPSSPPGVLLYLSPNNRAKLPIGWGTAIEDRNLIWISQNKRGSVKRHKEMFIAILATAYLETHYEIDMNRVYLAASADSCMPASAAAQIYPNIFKGAIYTTCEPINWRDQLPAAIDTMRQNRFVFIASNEKGVRQAMRRAERRYNQADIENTDYFHVPKLEYGKNVDRRKITQALEFLDAR